MQGSAEFTRRVRRRLRRLFARDLLNDPIGRASDESIDQALAARGLSRADLFTVPNALRRHRRRLAAMLAMHGLPPAKVTAEHWQDLKEVDNRCAHCPNPHRCESWLRWERRNDAPRMFCPNAGTFEKWKKNHEQG